MIAGDEESAVLVDATERCRVMMRENWGEVERLALALLSSPDGRLDGADIPSVKVEVAA
jgi:hypothetical protein